MKPTSLPFFVASLLTCFTLCISDLNAQQTVDLKKFLALRRNGSNQLKQGAIKEAINTFSAARTYLADTDTRNKLSIGDSIQKAYQKMVDNLDLARRKAVAEAKASELAGLAYDLAKSNPTMGLRVAEFATRINPESRSATQQLSDILSISPAPFFAKKLEHGTKATAIAFSSAKQLVISGTDDGLIIFWDEKGQKKMSIPAHQNQVSAIACAPEGNNFATGGVDNLIKIWDYSGKLVNTLTGHQGDISDLAYSPDGQYLISASWDHSIKIWNKQGQLQNSIPAHDDLISDIDVSFDGQLIASASWDQTVKIWDFKGQQLALIPAHKYAVLALAFSPDGKTLASSGWDSKVKIWNMQGQLQQTIDLNFGSALKVSYLKSNEIIVAGENANLYSYKNTGQQVQIYRGHFAKITGLFYSVSNNMVASSSEDGNVLVWPLDGTIIHDFKPEPGGAIQAFCQGPGDGSQFYLAKDSTLYAVNLQTKTSKKIFQSFYPILSVAYSPKNKLIVIGGSTNLFTILDEQGNKLHSIDTLKSNTRALQFSNDEQFVISSLSNGEARLWSTSLSLKASFKGHSDQVLSAAISPDNELVATASMDGYVFLWNNKGQLLDTLHHPSVSNDQVFQVVFSPDGKYIAAGGKSRVIEIWDRTGKPINKLSGHKGNIIDLGFSKDGKMFYSICSANIIRIWNRQGQLIQEISNGAPIYGAIFSNDGRKITTWEAGSRIKQRYTADGFLSSGLLAELNDNQKKQLDSLNTDVLGAFTVPPRLKDENMELFVNRQLYTQGQETRMNQTINWYWYLAMSLRQKAELSTRIAEKIYYAEKGIQQAKITMNHYEKRGPMITHLYNNPAFCYSSLALFHAVEGRSTLAQAYLDTAFTFKCEDVGKAVVQGKKALILAMNNQMEEAKNLIQAYGDVALDEQYLDLHGLLTSSEFKPPFTVKDEIKYTISRLGAAGVAKDKITLLQSLLSSAP